MKKSIIKEIIKEEIVKILKEEEKNPKAKLKQKFMELGSQSGNEMDNVESGEAKYIIQILDTILDFAVSDDKTKLSDVLRFVKTKISDTQKNKDTEETEETE